jgi:hypothetical protein
MVGLIMSKIFPLVRHQQMCTICRALEIQVDMCGKKCNRCVWHNHFKKCLLRRVKYKYSRTE